MREPKLYLLTLGLAAVLASFFLAGAVHGAPSSTLAVLEAFPPHVTDADEPPEERSARLRSLSAGIDAATTDRLGRAVLAVLAWRETRLARYVHEDRCSDGPRGEHECDGGRARGPWQIHDAPGHTVPADDAGQARLAWRLWSSAYRRCGRVLPERDRIAGAFQSYGTGGMCAPSQWARARAAHVRRVWWRL